MKMGKWCHQMKKAMCVLFLSQKRAFLLATKSKFVRGLGVLNIKYIYIRFYRCIKTRIWREGVEFSMRGYIIFEYRYVYMCIYVLYKYFSQKDGG